MQNVTDYITGTITTGELILTFIWYALIYIQCTLTLMFETVNTNLCTSTVTQIKVKYNRKKW